MSNFEARTPTAFKGSSASKRSRTFTHGTHIDTSTEQRVQSSFFSNPFRLKVKNKFTDDDRAQIAKIREIYRKHVDTTGMPKWLLLGPQGDPLDRVVASRLKPDTFMPLIGDQQVATFARGQIGLLCDWQNAYHPAIRKKCDLGCPLFLCCEELKDWCMQISWQPCGEDLSADLLTRHSYVTALAKDVLFPDDFKKTASVLCCEVQKTQQVVKNVMQTEHRQARTLNNNSLGGSSPVSPVVLSRPAGVATATQAASATDWSKTDDNTPATTTTTTTTNTQQAEATAVPSLKASVVRDVLAKEAQLRNKVDREYLSSCRELRQYEHWLRTQIPLHNDKPSTEPQQPMTTTTTTDDDDHSSDAKPPQDVLQVLHDPQQVASSSSNRNSQESPETKVDSLNNTSQPEVDQVLHVNPPNIGAEETVPQQVNNDTPCPAATASVPPPLEEGTTTTTREDATSDNSSTDDNTAMQRDIDEADPEPPQPERDEETDTDRPITDEIEKEQPPAEEENNHTNTLHTNNNLMMPTQHDDECSQQQTLDDVLVDDDNTPEVEKEGGHENGRKEHVTEEEEEEECSNVVPHKNTDDRQIENPTTNAMEAVQTPQDNLHEHDVSSRKVIVGNGTEDTTDNPHADSADHIHQNDDTSADQQHPTEQLTELQQEEEQARASVEDEAASDQQILDSLQDQMRRVALMEQESREEEEQRIAKEAAAQMKSMSTKELKKLAEKRKKEEKKRRKEEEDTERRKKKEEEEDAKRQKKEAKREKKQKSKKETDLDDHTTTPTDELGELAEGYSSPASSPRSGGGGKVASPRAVGDSHIVHSLPDNQEDASARVVLFFSGYQPEPHTPKDRLDSKKEELNNRVTWLSCLAKFLGASIVTEFDEQTQHTITHIVVPPATRTIQTMLGWLNHKWVIQEGWITASVAQKIPQWIPEQDFGVRTTKPLSMFNRKRIFVSSSFTQEYPNYMSRCNLLIEAAGSTRVHLAEEAFIALVGSNEDQSEYACPITLNWDEFLNAVFPKPDVKGYKSAQYECLPRHPQYTSQMTLSLHSTFTHLNRKLTKPTLVNPQQENLSKDLLVVLCSLAHNQSEREDTPDATDGTTTTCDEQEIDSQIGFKVLTTENTYGAGGRHQDDTDDTHGHQVTNDGHGDGEVGPTTTSHRPRGESLKGMLPDLSYLVTPGLPVVGESPDEIPVKEEVLDVFDEIAEPLSSISQANRILLTTITDLVDHQHITVLYDTKHPVHGLTVDHNSDDDIIMAVAYCKQLFHPDMYDKNMVMEVKQHTDTIINCYDPDKHPIVLACGFAFKLLVSILLETECCNNMVAMFNGVQQVVYQYKAHPNIAKALEEAFDCPQKLSAEAQQMVVDYHAFYICINTCMEGLVSIANDPTFNKESNITKTALADEINSFLPQIDIGFNEFTLRSFRMEGGISRFATNVLRGRVGRRFNYISPASQYKFPPPMPTPFHSIHVPPSALGNRQMHPVLLKSGRQRRNSQETDEERNKEEKDRKESGGFFGNSLLKKLDKLGKVDVNDTSRFPYSIATKEEIYKFRRNFPELEDGVVGVFSGAVINADVILEGTLFIGTHNIGFKAKERKGSFCLAYTTILSIQLWLDSDSHMSSHPVLPPASAPCVQVFTRKHKVYHFFNLKLYKQGETDYHHESQITSHVASVMDRSWRVGSRVPDPIFFARPTTA